MFAVRQHGANKKLTDKAKNKWKVVAIYLCYLALTYLTFTILSLRAAYDPSII